jgi:hypothetical protein
MDVASYIFQNLDIAQALRKVIYGYQYTHKIQQTTSKKEQKGNIP